MRRLILHDTLPDLAEVLGVCAENASGRSLIVRRVNEAQERLLNRANAPVGGKQRLRICVSSDACIVWPRQVRTIESYWLCSQPGLVAGEWHETVGWDSGGRGLQSGVDGACGSTLLDHGIACSFDNVQSSATSPRRIQAVASHPSDNGKFITLRYLDATGQRVYTSIDGVVQEGERLSLSTTGVFTGMGATPPTDGRIASGGLYHVIKAATSYPVRLYSWDVNASVQVALIAYYEPSETTPIYRRSLVPGLGDVSGCCGSDSGDRPVITVAARLQHVPFTLDNDPLVIGNLPALIDMVRALKLRRDNYFNEADVMEANAVRELDGEQAAYTGDGALITPRFPPIDTWGAAGIANSQWYAPRAYVA